MSQPGWLIHWKVWKAVSPHVERTMAYFQARASKDRKGEQGAGESETDKCGYGILAPNV